MFQEMEKLVEEDLVKHIGISNFNTKQIQHILDNATIKPATNQVINFTDDFTDLEMKLQTMSCESRTFIDYVSHSANGSPGFT